MTQRKKTCQCVKGITPFNVPLSEEVDSLGEETGPNPNEERREISTAMVEIKKLKERGILFGTQGPLISIVLILLPSYLYFFLLSYRLPRRKPSRTKRERDNPRREDGNKDLIVSTGHKGVCVELGAVTVTLNLSGTRRLMGFGENKIYLTPLRFQT